MYSSVRAPRRAKGTPIASNSSLSQPMPTPSSSRPPVMKSRVAVSLARTRGLRCGSTMTPVRKRSRVVSAATWASQIKGSGRSVDGPPGSLPVGE